MARKKIIHIVLGKANPNRMNGVNRVVHFLSEAQISLGLDVEVWGLSSNKELDETVVRSYDLRIFINGSTKIDAADLRKAIKENQEVVYHLHGGFIRVFSLLALEINKAGAHYLFTPHGCFTKGAMAQNKWRKKAFYYLYERNLIKNARFVQCLGYQEKSDLQSLVKKANTISVPNGQERIQFKKSEARNKKDSLVFGYCGRLDRHHKGLDLLIGGFIKFKQNTQSKNKLWIIGDGPYAETMKLLVSRSKLEEDVVFYGKKFGDEKFNLISEMDVFFHSSRHEGLPTAVLEACSLGVPSAVTPFTSFDRCLEKNDAGWRINGTSVEAVYSTMLQIEMDERAGKVCKKAINAEKMIKRDFTWERIAETLQEYYNF